jgi:hypothetical protein
MDLQHSPEEMIQPLTEQKRLEGWRRSTPTIKKEGELFRVAA